MGLVREAGGGEVQVAGEVPLADRFGGAAQKGDVLGEALGEERAEDQADGERHHVGEQLADLRGVVEGLHPGRDKGDRCDDGQESEDEFVPYLYEHEAGSFLVAA